MRVMSEWVMASIFQVTSRMTDMFDTFVVIENGLVANLFGRRNSMSFYGDRT